MYAESKMSRGRGTSAVEGRLQLLNPFCNTNNFPTNWGSYHVIHTPGIQRFHVTSLVFESILISHQLCRGIDGAVRAETRMTPFSNRLQSIRKWAKQFANGPAYMGIAVLASPSANRLARSRMDWTIRELTVMYFKT